MSTDLSLTVTDPEWRLEIHTFRGLVPGAVHYSGTMRRAVWLPIPGDDSCWSGRDSVRPERVLDAAGARALSTSDFRWHAGDTTTRFFTSEEVKAAAIETFERYAGPGEWLVMEHPVYDEDIVLAGEVGTRPARPSSSRTGPKNPLNARRFPS